MANFNVRLPDELAARFDGWAAERGGRSPALRHLIEQASGAAAPSCEPHGRLAVRPVKLTVRLSADDGRGLDDAAAEMGLSRNAWAAALIRSRPTTTASTWSPKRLISRFALATARGTAPTPNRCSRRR